jgi:hypothetical protein
MEPAWAIHANGGEHNGEGDKWDLYSFAAVVVGGGGQ